MSKRSQTFPRRKQDAYYTPYEAVLPLLPHLGQPTLFAEPCAGAGDLVAHLTKHGHVCTYAGDISDGRDALSFEAWDSEAIITNPPWSRDLLHPMILHFSDQRPTWLLFDADWMHTKQAIPYLARCCKIISVGRVSWMQNGTSSLDNCAWYLFTWETSGLPEFVARVP